MTEPRAHHHNSDEQIYKITKFTMSEVTALLLILLIICLQERALIANEEIHVAKHQPKYFIFNGTKESSGSFEKKSIDLPADSPSLHPGFLKEMTLKWQSFSFANIDFVVNNILNDKSDGYFVDLASNDWKYHSNTYMWEHFNMWRGVCIEPNPNLLLPLLANRKCPIYVNPVSNTTGEMVKFATEKGVECSITIDSSEKIIEMRTVTLMDILVHAKAPAQIDYLSLNVNGAEYLAMQNFNFTQYKFLVISIHLPPLELHHLLVKNEYSFVYEIVYMHTCLYIHKSLSNYAHVMKKYYKHHNNRV